MQSHPTVCILCSKLNIFDKSQHVLLCFHKSIGEREGWNSTQQMCCIAANVKPNMERGGDLHMSSPQLAKCCPGFLPFCFSGNSRLSLISGAYESWRNRHNDFLFLFFLFNCFKYLGIFKIELLLTERFFLTISNWSLMRIIEVFFLKCEYCVTTHIEQKQLRIYDKASLFFFFPNNLMQQNNKQRVMSLNFEETVRTLTHSVFFGSTVTHSLVTVIQTSSIPNSHFKQCV